jgi:hypothetical protein
MSARAAREQQPPTCVICTVEIDQVGCCSRTCLEQARRELEENVARLRRLRSHDDGPTETKHRLTRRNGELSSALMRGAHLSSF